MKKHNSSCQNPMKGTNIIGKEIKSFLFGVFILLGARGYAQEKVVDKLLD